MFQVSDNTLYSIGHWEAGVGAAACLLFLIVYTTKFRRSGRYGWFIFSLILALFMIQTYVVIVRSNWLTHTQTLVVSSIIFLIIMGICLWNIVNYYAANRDGSKSTRPK